VNHPEVVLDANLFVLFVVGTTNRNLIGRHKRLKAFSLDDFDLLCRIIASSRDVLVTPNTLTETSNLLGHLAEPARTKVFETFRQIIGSVPEHYVESRGASEEKEFLRLGLTDCVLMQTVNESRYLLTTNLHLFLSTMARGAEAVNFNHLRDIRLSTRGTRS